MRLLHVIVVLEGGGNRLGQRLQLRGGIDLHAWGLGQQGDMSLGTVADCAVGLGRIYGCLAHCGVDLPEASVVDGHGVVGHLALVDYKVQVAIAWVLGLPVLEVGCIVVVTEVECGRG